MYRKKDKYPNIPSDFSAREIQAAVAKAGSIKGSAVSLGVNETSLTAAIQKRKIRVKKMSSGATPRFDWEVIEKAWRARSVGTVAAKFAEEHGMHPSTFYSKAEYLGFYGAPPENGRALAALAPKRAPGTNGIAMMTSENKARAIAALSRIRSRNIVVELILNEKRVHAAAMTAASARARTRSGAA